MQNNHFITSWSGGKDSCLATVFTILDEYKLTGIVTVLNENGKISRSHAIPLHILQQQAAALNVPLYTRPSSWQDYETNFTALLTTASKNCEASIAVFGDIDNDSHKLWEEKTAANAGMVAKLPLWKKDPKKIVQQALQCNIEAIIISCNNQLGETFLGKKLNAETVYQLEAAGVDVCGENGEFHTLVVNCPMFSNSIQYQVINKLKHQDYYFLEIE